MLVSYHWLKKFVNLRQTPEEIGQKITLNLVEVESLAKKGDDTILEIENKGITNRPDCFSQLGVAREVAAYFNLKLNDPLPALKQTKNKALNQKLSLKVEIKEPRLCYRYTSVVLTNIKVGPSPKWLRVGLQNCGVNSINNVVDITNYVMLELGQPLHAFDYDKVSGKKILVRLAKKGEKITSFEGATFKLTPENLIIADQEKPLALAGIIGGKRAEINSQTKTIVLESANFDKINNRRSEKELKVRTEASTRFEKGLDINLTLPALNRAVNLLKEYAGAQAASEIIDPQIKKVGPWQVKVSPVWINQFLGIKLTPVQIRTILKRLQLESKNSGKDLLVKIPTYRSDLTRPADIAEEIARIYGYDKIPVTLPVDSPTPQSLEPVIDLRFKTKKFLASIGFSENLTQPFLGKDLLENLELKPGTHLRLVNPLTLEQEYLQRSLIPSSLPIIKENLKNFDQFKLFEINRVFIPQGKKQPVEIPSLMLLVVGKESYLHLKGALEALFEFLGIKVFFKPEKGFCFWQGNQTAKIIDLKGKRLGLAGKIKDKILAKLEIKSNLSLAELNLAKMVKLANMKKTYQPILKYPPIIEDLSFVIKRQTPVGELIQLIKKASPDARRRGSSIKNRDSIIKSVELVDSYKNTRTLRITYQSQKRTLTDQEVGKLRKKIIAQAKQVFKATVKSV